MKRLYGMIFTVAMLAFGFGAGCLISDGNDLQGECCYNFERCETYCDPFGHCEKSCWFETTCPDTCDGSGQENPGDNNDSGGFCYSDRDCAGVNICIDNACRRPDTTERGDAGLCQACETNSNCVDPKALCVRLGPVEGGGEKVCTTPCAGGCPTGFECENIGGSSQCLPAANAQQQRSCAAVPELECVTARDCGPGESCVNNECEAPDTAECSGAGDCATGEICRLGECVADDTPECTTRNDCATGQICLNGECSGGNETCVFNKDCSDDAMCVNGNCYSECSADDQCGRYEHCRQGLCQPTQCTGTADCAGDEVCVDATCKPACEPATSSDVCGTGYVCTDLGYCDRDPGVQCRSNAECLRSEICLEGSCESPCTCNQDCAGGQVCDLDSGTCESPGAAAPQTCETTCDCVSGEQCNSSGQCVAG